MSLRRSKPIKVFYSELSQRFYASRAYKLVKVSDDKAIYEITGEKFDVTNDIAAAISRHDLTFTLFEAGKDVRPT